MPRSCASTGHRNTYFNWKSRYSGAEISELRRLRELEQENARLKKMYSDEANREVLAIEVATSIPTVRVLRVLDELVALYGAPAALRTLAKSLSCWHRGTSSVREVVVEMRSSSKC